MFQLLENPTLCGTEIGQNGTLPVLAYMYCRQWECPPPVLAELRGNVIGPVCVFECLYDLYPGIDLPRERPMTLPWDRLLTSPLALTFLGNDL